MQLIENSSDTQTLLPSRHLLQEPPCGDIHIENQL